MSSLEITVNMLFLVSIAYLIFDLITLNMLYKSKKILLNELLNCKKTNNSDLKEIKKNEFLFRKNANRNIMLFIPFFSIFNVIFFYFNFPGKELFFILTIIVLARTFFEIKEEMQLRIKNGDEQLFYSEIPICSVTNKMVEDTIKDLKIIFKYPDIDMQ